MRTPTPGTRRSASDTDRLRRATANDEIPPASMEWLVQTSRPLDHAGRTDALALGGMEGSLRTVAETRENIVRGLPREGDLALALASLRHGKLLTLATLYDEPCPPLERGAGAQGTLDEAMQKCLCSKYERLADATLACVAAESKNRGVAEARAERERVERELRNYDVRRVLPQPCSDGKVREAERAHGRLCDYYCSPQCTEVATPRKPTGARRMPRSSDDDFANAKALADVVFGSESDVLLVAHYVRAEWTWVRRQKRCVEREARGGAVESGIARDMVRVLCEMEERLRQALTTLSAHDTARRPAEDTVALLRWRGSRRPRRISEAIDTVAAHLVDQRSDGVVAMVMRARELAKNVVLRRVVAGAATEWGAACAVCACEGVRLRDSVWEAMEREPENIVPFIDEVATMHPHDEGARRAVREYPCEHRTGDMVVPNVLVVVAVDARYGCRVQYRICDLAREGACTWYTRGQVRFKIDAHRSKGGCAQADGLDQVVAQKAPCGDPSERQALAATRDMAA